MADERKLVTPMTPREVKDLLTTTLHSTNLPKETMNRIFATLGEWRLIVKTQEEIYAKDWFFREVVLSDKKDIRIVMPFPDGYQPKHRWMEAVSEAAVIQFVLFTIDNLLSFCKFFGVLGLEDDLERCREELLRKIDSGLKTKKGHGPEEEQ